MRHWAALHETLNWIARLAMIPIVLRRPRTQATVMAWLAVIFFYPLAGVIAYALFGNTHLSKARVKVHQAALRDREARVGSSQAAGDDPAAAAAQREALSRQACRISGLPVVGGNGFVFHTKAAEVAAGLIADIDAAARYVHLLFYIWGNDAVGHAVADAVVRAARRGVRCRVIVDDLGSHAFFKPGGPAEKLRAANVPIVAALPAGIRKLFFSRIDLRNHRKLAIIDGQLAWFGSMNCIDPSYGGKRGGPWQDVMARVTGPVIAQLHLIFLEDWAAETGEVLHGRDATLLAAPAPAGGIASQVVATGPVELVETFRRVIVAMIDESRHTLTLSTPYFIPDEPTLLALCMAADRGVRVRLIVPEQGDQRFAAAAARANFHTLLQAGCEVYLFQPGLIHAKTTAVDDRFAMIGSANLDPRSFNLNFELNAILYGPEATAQVEAVQAEFLAHCRKLELAEMERRSTARQYAERLIGLISPLL